MNHQYTNLPTPSIAQISRSQKLSNIIYQKLAAHNNWLPFDDYMSTALYTPELGYYTNENSPFSMWATSGDFITAPLLTPLFGACLAYQAIEVFKRTNSFKILEIGAGTGRLAADILTKLTELHIDVQYFILELSASLRAEQQATVTKITPKIISEVTWLDELPSNFNGLIIGNEVLDAMPVKLIGMNHGRRFERGISQKNGELIYIDQATDYFLPMNPEWIEALKVSNSFYLSETHHQQIAFMLSLKESLRQGVIIMLDYGFPAHEFYHPQRNEGTLMCHIQHVAHADALYYPGVQDITAHVNFSALKNIPGLSAIGYCNQANFLINNGLLELITQSPDPRVSANHTLRLISEAEMGELFKVMAWSRGLSFDHNDTLQGFTRGDRLHTL